MIRFSEGLESFIVKHNISKKHIQPTRIIIGVFLIIIAVGALLLSFPISSSSREWTDPLTALFTATSATCVTGLSLFDTFTHWSLFGQVVILALIQIGGLGFMTIISIVLFLLNKRIGLRERLVMAQSMNVTDIDGIVKMIRHTLFGTLAFESAGAFLLSFTFMPRYGFGQGLWMSVFHSVSAFCNAGFDIMGIEEPGTSLMGFYDSPAVLLPISALIIIGGAGFFVWEDIWIRKRFRSLRIHSRLVLIMTAILLFGGTVAFYLLERSNPETLGNFSEPVKWLDAFFQSVTTRTAGFNTMPQDVMTEQSDILTIVLMMIGGNSGSTAGGVKTVTVCMLVLGTVAVFKGRKELVVMDRSFSYDLVFSAAALVGLSITLVLSGGIAISLADNVPLIESLFEAASAYGTVGLSMGITTGLGVFSKILLMILMFFGRIGVMTIAIAIAMGRKANSNVRYPAGSVMIG